MGINALFLEPGMGGLETYVRRLVGEVVAADPLVDLTLICNARGRDLLRAEPWAGDVRFRTAPVLGRHGLRMATELTLLGWLASECFDVVHSPALTGPLRTRAAHVVVLADITWIVAPTGTRDVRLTEFLWRRTVPVVARRADRAIALSSDGATHIRETLHVSPDRIDVIPLGTTKRPAVTATSKPVLRARLGLPPNGPVLLHVGMQKRHKNQVGLVEALPRILETHSAAALVLVGARGGYEREIRAAAERLGISDRVVLCGYVDEEDLQGLYDLASVFAFPSTNEGFGLPILEAMERGVPVACSSVSALPEVAGDAAVLFDPRRPDAIAAALVRILSSRDLRAALTRAGRKRQEAFTWRRTAEQTLRCWERAATARRR